MSRVVKGVFIAVLLMVVSLTLFACKMPQLPDLSCSGTVTIDAVGLEGVIIKSSVKEYAITNSSGNFEFTTKAKSLVVYPYKEGYMFTPSSISLTDGENTATIVATKVEALEGTLTLKEVIITPTSISTLPDNYTYTYNDKICLKASDINIVYESNNYLLNAETIYLYQNEKNAISVEDNITFNCGENKRVGIFINAYFKWSHSESKTTETEASFLDILVPQTNADLVDGQVKYSLYGINNKSRSFTFDITFLFDFEENTTPSNI